MANNKKNFLSKSIHHNSDHTQSHLIVCAPANDDADYEWVTEVGINEAITKVTSWFVDNDIPHVVEMNYGDPWSLENSHQFSVNVVIRADKRPMTKDERIIFELKFLNKFPITNLGPYIEAGMKRIGEAESEQEQ